MTAGDSSSWDEFFQQNLVPTVLSYVIDVWERMPKPGASELEDAISVELYSALVRGKDRSRHAFLIRYEDVEVDTDLAKVTGKKDIVFFPPTNDERIYLCLEAKRLNVIDNNGRRQSLAGEYVKEGMQRFVDGKYARYVRHGAMLAYVLDGDADRAIRNVEKSIRKRRTELRMEQNGGFVASTIRPGDPRTKETHHRRVHEKAAFRIHHLFMAGDATGHTAATAAHNMN